MKTLINRRSIIILAIAVLIAISTIVSVNIWGAEGPVTTLANAVSSPLRSLASTVASVFESIYSSIYRYDDLMDEYVSAVRRIVELERTHRESIDIAEDNLRLRALLGFRERHSGYEHIDAQIVDRSSSNWSSSFIIDLGSANSSIERGNAVVTEYGVLIGQISAVGEVNSTVVTVLDTTFSCGALIGESGGRATAKGDFAFMRSGLLMLDHLDENLVVRPGDSVVTSGAAGVFPVGLVVGQVEEVLRHSTGVGRYATVKPMLDVETIKYVYVITGFEIIDPE